MTEAGLRKVFRVHRARSGATRVRPHRLRHTYGTELAAAGIDLLVLRELMGHASPETTARYVHLAPDTLAAEFAAARAVTGDEHRQHDRVVGAGPVGGVRRAQRLLGGQPTYRRVRLRAARAFLDDHPDLTRGWRRPVDAPAR